MEKKKQLKVVLGGIKENQFKEVFIRLMNTSYSIKQSCTHNKPNLLKTTTKKSFITELISALVTNVYNNTPTCNGVNWEDCKINITAFGVDYCTSGGLKFGWFRIFDDDIYRGDLRIYVVVNENGTLHNAIKEKLSDLIIAENVYFDDDYNEI